MNILIIPLLAALVSFRGDGGGADLLTPDHFPHYDRVVNTRDLDWAFLSLFPDAPSAKAYPLLQNVPDDIELLLIKYAAKYALPLDVVVRLSQVESNHGAFAHSQKPNYDGSYDIGVLALNSNYHDYFAGRFFEGEADSFDPHNREHNIQTGLAYLAYLKGLTGDIALAVTAYNCGYVNLKKGRIPASTRRYVRAVVHGEPL